MELEQQYGIAIFANPTMLEDAIYYLYLKHWGPRTNQRNHECIALHPGYISCQVSLVYPSPDETMRKAVTIA